jgi:uncharacterized repeat protein (TIGR01451 family)
MIFLTKQNILMKKTYLLLAAILVFLMGGSTPAFAVNFLSHFEQDSCSSGVTYYFTLNSGAGTITERTYFGDGTSTLGTISGSYGNNWHQYGLPGIYTVKHVLYQNANPVDSLIFTDTVMCQNGYIAAYLDANSNCTWNSGEPFLRFPVDVEIDSAGVKIDTITLMGGAYRPLTVGKTYSMKILNLPAGLSVSCPTGGIRTVTVSGTGPTIYDFALQCGTSSSFDVAENVSVRAGRHAEVVDINVTTSNCTPQTITLTANLSPKYGVFMSAYPTPTSRTANVLTWTIPNVSAFSSNHFSIHYETAGTTSGWLTPGDTVHTSFFVTPTIGDSNPTNNSVVRVDTVRSSFDPNAKTVYPSGAIAPGATLEYSIEFENDGNAAAQNIHILDTLSSSLNVNSVKILSSSAPVTNTSVIQIPGANVLRFDMPGINLLDSSHHGQCTGMVVFSIKAKTGLANGTVIKNRAGIYFDDNPVVMTDYAQNNIPTAAAGVGTLSVQMLEAYPNPVTDVLNIDADGSIHSAQLINAMGQVVVEQRISGKTRMDVRALPNGVYYLMLKGTQGTKAQKIQKQ